MKTILSIFVLAALSGTSPVWSQHQGHDHKNQPDPHEIQGVANAACATVIDVKVNGLVCDFCARALEKVFSRQSAVSGIDVDLHKGEVKIALHPNQTLDDATLGKLITDSGYNIVNISRGC